MPHGRWIGLSHPCPSAPTMPWHGSSSKSSFPEKCCSIFRWTEPRIGPDVRRLRKPPGKMAQAVDGRITLPLIDQPIADAELEAELFHIPVVGVEVLMVHHAGRHMHRVALIPVITLAANL